MPEEAEEAELQSQPCAIPGGDTEQIATLAKPVTVSKRAKHRAHLRAKVEKRSAHLPPDTHEVRLRSGKSIQIPDRLQPEAFIRKIRLDKNKALANRPEICQSLVIGLNAVTRYLEDSLEAGRCELSGRPYPNDAAFGSRTAATHLRLSVPTPNHGTRRDRRALKERIRPGRSAQKQKLGRSSKSATVPRLPPYLVVPRSEPILPFMLQEIQARLKNESGEASDAGVFLDNIESMAASLEDQKSTQNAPSAECKGSSAERALQQGVWQIPSDLVDAIVFSAGQKITEDQNRDRSMLLALLMRCDPGWFQAWRQRDEWQKRLRKSWEQENPGIDTPKATSINPLSHSTLRRPLRLVFVAKADINPVHLVQHLLTSVSANNSLNLARRNLVESSGSNADGTETIDAYEDIYLVPLPKGAEERLATLLALRRVSVLAFTVRVV